MLTIIEALDILAQQVQRLPPVHSPLAKALGQVLAENVVADIDSPPFDKALMDGYAIRSVDIQTAAVRLRVIEEVMAGQIPTRSVGPHQATRIMTGAPMPAGADAVVQVEHSRLDGDSFVVLETTSTVPGRNILPRGASVKAGQTVLREGDDLRPQQLGALAELGKAEVAVYRRPRVAVLATGDELVPVSQQPGPGQIRNSNETMLVAQLEFAGVEAIPLGIARDDVPDLRDKITRGLEADVLLLSGGVSAGVLDLVPGTLRELGVREVFHKVRIKPGQPLWFGVAELPDATSSIQSPAIQSPRRCYVFGLPGNPVSSMVCCELFVRTALRRLMGATPAEPRPMRAKLTRPHFNRGDRPTYHPARLSMESEGFTVETVPWVGSADLCATSQANAMVLFAKPDNSYSPGDLVDVFAW